ncbi:MAG: 30S ribosomal protein S4 [Deltaproteobacteria bacterium]|nr:30S ribosomal protein S4 [Deltaproteobacteria bacterium]
MKKEDKCKLCRQLGVKLYLKGDRCLTEKCAFERRPYPPGKERFQRRKMSDYARHLMEKQKARAIYGVREKQFKRYFFGAKRRKGKTGENLISILESRLDNMLYRAGFATSRKQARQMVLHRFVKINNRLVNTPSYFLKKGDIVELVDKAKEDEFVKTRIEETIKRSIPSWLQIDAGKFTFTVLNIPSTQEVNPPFNENAIVELYSK